MRIASDAYLPAALPAGTAVLAFVLGWQGTGAILAVVAVAILLFFRDPERTIPREPGLVVSPADGRVIAVVAEPPAAGAAPRLRVSIFLSLFDVHINRAPAAGRVAGVRYHAGGFLPAFDDKASERNEQNRIEIDGDDAPMTVVQIAGLVARRIVCRVSKEDRVERGERIGLIKFGSRVDLFLPATVELSVKVGDRVRGGSSVIGRLARAHAHPV